MFTCNAVPTTHRIEWSFLCRVLLVNPATLNGVMKSYDCIRRNATQLCLYIKHANTVINAIVCSVYRDPAPHRYTYLREGARISSSSSWKSGALGERVCVCARSLPRRASLMEERIIGSFEPGRSLGGGCPCRCLAHQSRDTTIPLDRLSALKQWLQIQTLTKLQVGKTRWKEFVMRLNLFCLPFNCFPARSKRDAEG